mgnify:CR=1 FL=1
MKRQKTITTHRKKTSTASKYLMVGSLATVLFIPSVFVQTAFSAQEKHDDMKPNQTAMDSQDQNEQRAIKRGNRALIDREIRSRNGETIGEIENVVVDSTGQVQYVIVEIDGFWGLGSEESMVPLDKLSLTKNRGYVYFKGTEEELEMFPDYSDYGWAGRRYESSSDAWFNNESERYENSDMEINGWAENREGERTQKTGRYAKMNNSDTDIDQDSQAYTPTDERGDRRSGQKTGMNNQRQMDKKDRMHSKVMQSNRQDRSRQGYKGLSSLRSSSNSMQNIDWQEYGSQGIQASKLMDKEVHNTNDEKLGTVDDVVITPAGDIRLLLSVGEALNIKDKKIQADLQDIQFKEDADYIVYDVSKQELKNDPEYRPDKRTASLSKTEKNKKSASSAQTSANKAENTKKQQQ